MYISHKSGRQFLPAEILCSDLPLFLLLYVSLFGSGTTLIDLQSLGTFQFFYFV